MGGRVGRDRLAAVHDNAVGVEVSGPVEGSERSVVVAVDDPGDVPVVLGRVGQLGHSAQLVRLLGADAEVVYCRGDPADPIGDVMPETKSEQVQAISLGISFAAGAIWVAYALTGAPKWLLVVGILFSMFTGWWWAAGRKAVFPSAMKDGGRHRNRQRGRDR